MMLKRFTILNLMLGMILLMSCSQKKTLDEFTSSLPTLSVDQLMDKYIVFDDMNHKAQVQTTYKASLNHMKSNVRQGNVEIMSYIEAKSKYPEVLDIINHKVQKNTYILRFENGDINYIFMKKKKIKSILPMKQGTVISGWL